MRVAGCPVESELVRFAVGDLPQAEFVRLADHVLMCAHCEATLQTLEASEDPLLTQLRSPGLDAIVECEVPARLLQAAQSVRALSPPRSIGKFEILEEIGSGSFGRVFRARDTQADRIVAIKLMRAGRFAGREEVDRFLREARSAAQLQHPGIVAIHETGQTDDGICYLVEELVQGQTLANLLTRQRMPLRTAAELMMQIASALDFAHSQGIVHRDIKPSNIMIDGSGRAHVMDFGLAKCDTDDTPMTMDGQVLGTPAYMSPEQARGEANRVDARTDIYSLGVVLYELLTGERPFRGNRRMLLLQVIQDEPRAPRRLNDKIPAELETICLKAMAKAPARRYHSAGDLARDLERWLNGQRIVARPMGRVQRLGRWCRRYPLAAGLLLAVTLGSAAGMWHLIRLSDYLVKQSALESAAQQAEVFDQVNDYYSADVVDRLQGTGVVVTHDYKDPRYAKQKKKAVPLPATLSIELGRLSAKGKTGMQMRMYSDYPFRLRKQTGEAGPRDAFEEQALVNLRSDPSTPFYRFEDYQGKPSLRYATAQRFKKSCIDCHNQHEDSTKKNWKEGDIGGVVEIIRPLDADVERTRVGLQGTFLGMALIAGSLLAVSLVWPIVADRRRRAALARSDPSRV